ncbi:hypothetical protein PHYBLDRAFT_70301 [Phycomyces blakesleeanus NRRL 1555(-)]|uniref:Uncharacterized protein n=1 Tax=Phycomyces blakesleeanus (strain ATCC 8743b / DSM 1359 / FGSC 10004 / NBRC 33097 / NRRL 1555) TaxID=763407 RepID=A0A162T8W9_PHYB8|nr:hypothetical protein PHYBLDRAFT_70301 [Phycomyces blakesleeanus NRRL 1555(-)]OAD66942.1 hypothetical protein PHYBLDRAFT_70301 [Phycomyces blakesleeanus NRRL 1555(-)]|eukprot:XP_018284982.1 hypothetical protein PHYBLDRAFT_70301 [Phycomyces blakesleeanus NRRL 1555(-)]
MRIMWSSLILLMLKLVRLELIMSIPIQILREIHLTGIAEDIILSFSLTLRFSSNQYLFTTTTFSFENLNLLHSHYMTIPPQLSLSSVDVNAAEMLTTLYLTFAAKALLVPQFCPGIYINSWLSLYKTETTLVGVSLDLLDKFLPNYLPPDIGEWICISGTYHNWATLTELLMST